MVAPTPRRPGPESTLDEVRAKLIAAAMDLLRERGGDVGLAEITLSETIERAEVTRSTAYRSLGNDVLAPQAVLHRELLTLLLTRYSHAETTKRWEDEMARELERQAQNLRSDDLALRTYAVRSIVRVGANVSYVAITELPHRAVLSSIYGALHSSTDRDWRHEQMKAGEHDLMQHLCGVYGGAAEQFGLRLRPSLTLGQFCAAGVSLLEGMAIRHEVNEHVAMIDRPTGINGETEPWSLFAIGFESLLTCMFEPADSERPFVDLQRY